MIRRLGLLESFCAEFHQRFFSGLLVVATAKITGKFNQEIAKKALKVLHDQHQILQTTLIKQDDYWYFSLHNQFSSIPIQFHTTFTHSLVDLVEKELNTSLAEEHYLWRLNFYENYNDNKKETLLIFAGHHAIFDGQSLISFLHAFIAIYNSLIEHKPIENHQYPLLASVEKLLPIKPGQKESSPIPGIDNDSAWPFKKFATMEKRKACVSLATIEQSLINKLHHCTKQQGITINAALMAAMFFAAQSLPNIPQKKTLGVPINVRRWCVPEVSQQQIGAYIATVGINYEKTITYKTFWDAARELHQQFLTHYPDVLHGKAEHDTTSLNSLIERYESQEQNHFMIDMCLTNLGNQSFASDEACDISDLSFATSTKPGQAAIILSLVTINQQRMNLTFNFVEPLIDRETVTKFQQRLIDCLEISSQ